MGRSADAKLAFGFDLGDECELDVIEIILGMEECPMEVIHHGYDFSGTFLAIRESIQTAYWEQPALINLNALVAPPEANIEAAKEFCEKHGIEWENSAWYLMAHYA